MSNEQMRITTREESFTLTYRRGMSREIMFTDECSNYKRLLEKSVIAGLNRKLEDKILDESFFMEQMHVTMTTTIDLEWSYGMYGYSMICTGTMGVENFNMESDEHAEDMD